MLNIVVYAGERASSILQDNRSWWEKMWEDHPFLSFFLLLVAVLVVVVTVYSVIYFIRRRYKKISETDYCVNLQGCESVMIRRNNFFFAPVPEKEGFIFCGWFYDSAFTRPYYNTKITSDIALYPRWQKL